MTGKEMFKKSLILLGYTDSMGETSAEQRFNSRAITAVNAIYGDLYYTQGIDGFKPIERLEDEINLSERALNDIMPYGVAMLLAQSEGAGDEQQLFSSIYNQKRAAMSRITTIEDVIPSVE